jgi:hypothetical protein
MKRRNKLLGFVLSIALTCAALANSAIASDFSNGTELNPKNSGISLEDTISLSNAALFSTGNTTPNNAVLIDGADFGYYLEDTANAVESWYYFQTTATSKISIFLSHPTSGDYDLQLYKLNGTTLNLVYYSEYGGVADEHVSYVGSAGSYYLDVVPFQAATAGSTYDLRIDSITTYDVAEPDDYVDFADTYSSSIDVYQTMDNPHDVDNFKLTVSSSGTRLIRLQDIPTDRQYAVIVYNSALTPLLGFVSADTEVRQVALNAGDYYLQVFSYDLEYDSGETYNLVVEPGKLYTSKTGQIIEATLNSLSINGVPIDLNWSFTHQSPGYPYYTRTQGIHTTSNTLVDPYSISTGSFSGSQGVSASNAIRVGISNVWYSYYYFESGGGGYEYVTEDITYPSLVYIYINTSTGQVIDTDINYYYVVLGHNKTFS